MREVNVQLIEDAVAELFQQANRVLPQDLADRIAEAKCAECASLAQSIMGDICENLSAAEKMHVPICQDTGMAVLFCDLGQDVHLVGGDFEQVAELAKRALLVPLDENNPDPFYAELEERMLTEINKTGIGSQGFGGTVTALYVNIESAPTHIAGLPAAVNIGCHVTRHKERII